jgi:uncharacterized SAM-binding protein YcdF (DUF218 family)
VPASPSKTAALLQRLPLLAAGAATLGAFGLAFAVDRFGRRDRARTCDLIVVLGAKVLEGGVPSPALIARVEHGAALWHSGVAPRLLLSGGVGRFPPSEAEVMRDLALARGVPHGRIVLEAGSRNTAGNARLTAALMRARGFAAATIVSDPFHLLRARQHFRRYGFEVATSPAPLAGRGLARGDRLAWTLREAFALLASPAALFARPPR